MRSEVVFLGWDIKEDQAIRVAVHSLMARAAEHCAVRRVSMEELQDRKIYTRPTIGDLQLWDVISEAPMSTGHAIARFFIPYLMNYRGRALFTDGDVLFREDVAKLFDAFDDRLAIQVVQHQPMPDQATKKSGQIQTIYPRKNWSSVMLFNCEHPANRALTLDILNSWPGRDLHAFKWLEDSLIGALPASWNYLVGVTEPRPDPVSLAHFTLGTPDIEGHDKDPFADEWLAVLAETRSYAGGV